MAEAGKPEGILGKLGKGGRRGRTLRILWGARPARWARIGELYRRLWSVPVPKLREASEGLKGVRELLTYKVERGLAVKLTVAMQWLRDIVKWKKWLNDPNYVQLYIPLDFITNNATSYFSTYLGTARTDTTKRWTNRVCKLLTKPCPEPRSDVRTQTQRVNGVDSEVHHDRRHAFQPKEVEWIQDIYVHCTDHSSSK